MTYEEKLRLPSWQKRRLRILERDSWECTYCGCGDRKLEVHHKIYLDINNPADYPDDLLTTLCDTCHKNEIKRPVQERLLLTAFQMKGFLYGDLVTLACLIENDDIFCAQLMNILRKFKNG